MGQVIILSGPSGCGKSTWIENNFGKVYRPLMPAGVGAGTAGDDANILHTVVSADDYFIDAEGNYTYDATKIRQAHASCFEQFLVALLDKDATVIVDNTNCRQIEVAPYVQGADSFGFEHKIVQFFPPKGKFVDYNLVGMHEGFNSSVALYTRENYIKFLHERQRHNTPIEVVRMQLNNFDNWGTSPAWWSVESVRVEM